MAFEKLRIRLANTLDPRRKTPYDQTGNSYVPTRSEPPRRSTEEWLYTYGRSPRLGVVNKIAEDLSFATGRLFERNRHGEDVELPDNHPFWDFWNQPNPLPQFTKEAIWQLHEIYLLLVGEAFMVMEKDYLGYPAELWPIPPHWVIMTPTQGNPNYTIRTPSDLIGRIHVHDMFLQMELNPADPYGRGLGQAQGIADEVEIDEYSAAFEKRFFYNDATPSSVIAVEGADAEAIKRFEADWNNRHRGVENSHRTAITSGKVTVAKLADNMKDLDMLNGRRFTRDTALEHFHMPREIMGITENSNRATAEAAQYIYAQNVETPHLRKRQSAVNNQLVPYWGDNVHWKYDEIVPRNQEFDKAVAIEGYNAGLLMQNEGRDKLDMEPLKNGNVLKDGLLFRYVSEEQSLADAGGEDDALYLAPDPITGGKQYKSRVSRVDQRAMQMLERAQREQQRRAENAATQYFSRQRRRLLDRFRASGVAEKDAQAGSDFYRLQLQLEDIVSPMERIDRITSFVDRLEDWNQDEEQMKDLLTNIWSGSYEQGQGIMEQLYDLRNPNKPQARDIFKRMGGKQIAADISGTTKDAIIQVIDQGLADGLNVDELALQISSSGDLSRSRAQLIAEQETYNSLSAANFDAMQEGGTRRHKWVTRGDDLVRPEHRALNGQVREVGERFSNGLRYPRDREGPADEVIRCRCWTVPLRERPVTL